MKQIFIIITFLLIIVSNMIGQDSVMTIINVAPDGRNFVEYNKVYSTNQFHFLIDKEESVKDAFYQLSSDNFTRSSLNDTIDILTFSDSVVEYMNLFRINDQFYSIDSDSTITFKALTNYRFIKDREAIYTDSVPTVNIQLICHIDERFSFIDYKVEFTPTS